MPYAIYDYRRDVKNLFVTPQIRGRFLRMEPGEVHARHSHDLGHEVFLIAPGVLSPASSRAFVKLLACIEPFE